MLAACPKNRYGRTVAQKRTNVLSGLVGTGAASIVDLERFERSFPVPLPGQVLRACYHCTTSLPAHQQRHMYVHDVADLRSFGLLTHLRIHVGVHGVAADESKARNGLELHTIISYEPPVIPQPQPARPFLCASRGYRTPNVSMTLGLQPSW